LVRIGSGRMIGMTAVCWGDVSAYGGEKFGQRNESVITPTNTFLTKTSQAVAALVVCVGLSIFVYIRNDEQTALTINGLRILIIVLPIIFVILAAFLYHKAFHLKGDFLTDIEKTLQYKRQKEHRGRMSK